MLRLLYNMLYNLKRDFHVALKGGMPALSPVRMSNPDLRDPSGEVLHIYISASYELFALPFGDDMLTTHEGIIPAKDEYEMSQ